MPFQRFYADEMLKAPTRLVVHLSGLEDISKRGTPDAAECRYAYEVVIGGGTTPSVERETLHRWPSDASRRVRVFERNSDGDVSASKDFDLTGFGQALKKILRPNVSVIATLAQLEHPFSKAVQDMAIRVVSNILIEKYDYTDSQAINYLSANPGSIDKLNKELARIDLGIEEMRLVQSSQGPMAVFKHEGLSIPMPMLNESHGTRHFVRIYPTIFFALENGGVAVLDELDSTIHPMILPEILRWFHDPERNPHNAQLWMTCHNASLLEELSKEEVLFCEKDTSGCTRVYGLRDIQSVRRTDNFYRKYLGGAFGAVPRIG